jgi:hypothetical protein
MVWVWLVEQETLDERQRPTRTIVFSREPLAGATRIRCAWYEGKTKQVKPSTTTAND